jgi:hypothetical protein
MSNVLIPWLIALAGLFVVFVLAIILLKVINRVVETNKQLLILLAGQGGKPEVSGATMRALVASEKSPQGKLHGIAPGKKKEVKKPDNIDYKMQIGVR